MADNVTRGDTTNEDVAVASIETTWAGDTAHLQLMAMVGASGIEGSYTVGLLPGDATDGLLVNLGSNNDVTVSGTVTANLSATDNAVLDSIQTATEIIDNAVYVDDADWTAATSSHNLIGGVYQSSPGAITDGDTGPIRLDANGAVHINDGGNSITVDNSALTELAGAINSSRLDVNIANNDLNSSTLQDDAAFTPGTSYVTAIGFQADETTPDSVNEGDVGAPRMTLTRKPYAVITDPTSENNAAVDGSGHLQVDIAADSVGIGGGTQYTEDVATPAAIVGNALMMERDDALSTVTPIEGDWLGARGTAEGALWTQDFNSDSMNTALGAIQTAVELIDNAISGSEMQVDIVSGNVTNAGTFAVQVDGNALTALQLIDNPIVAHDAAASGSTGVNMAGAYATNSIEGLTQVANADAARIVSDLNGVLVTRNQTTLEELLSTSQSVTATTSTAATNFGAGGAGIHNYVSKVTVWNSSATNTHVKLQDGNGGTTRWVVPAPATGGAVEYFDPPLKQNTANTALYFAANDAASTVYVSINGFQAQG